MSAMEHHGAKPDDIIAVGVIGCGGFGLFALQHFMQIPGVRLAGMAGTHREAARAAALRFGVPDVVDVEQLVQQDDIDLIYIATPPFLHYDQAMAALRSGKHVICEKPMAMNLEQADEMLATARERDLLMVTNLMQRYNPIFERLGHLIESKILGELLHAWFENYACDEGLPPDHWFWDREKSGGIFIEHAVHFFDLFEGWMGRGEVIAAQATKRPGTEFEEQVQCTVRYGNAILSNFYHGFHQAGRMDRQQMRLLFEKGDVTLYEWIPTLVCVHAIADEAQTRTLMDVFPRARLDISATYGAGDRACRARHKELDVYQMIDITDGEGNQKMHIYGELLRAMFADQTLWIRDRTHKRLVTEKNGRNSLAMAIAADRLAHQ